MPVEGRFDAPEDRRRNEDDHHVDRHQDSAERDIGIPELEHPGDDIAAARRGAAQEDDRHPRAHEHAAEERGKQRVARVGGQRRGGVVDHDGQDDHRLEGAQGEPPAEEPEPDQQQRDIDEEGPDADRDLRQVVEHHRKAAHAARRDLVGGDKHLHPHGEGKAAHPVEGKLHQQFPQRFAQSRSLQRDPLPFRRGAGQVEKLPDALRLALEIEIAEERLHAGGAAVIGERRVLGGAGGVGVAPRL